MKYEQSFCKAIGDYGCYALCIINIAEEVTGLRYNILQKLEEAIDKGYITWNKNNYYDPKNFDVINPDLCLLELVGLYARKPTSCINLRKTNTSWNVGNGMAMVISPELGMATTHYRTASA